MKYKAQYCALTTEVRQELVYGQIFSNLRPESLRCVIGAMDETAHMSINRVDSEICSIKTHLL